MSGAPLGTIALPSTNSDELIAVTLKPLMGESDGLEVPSTKERLYQLHVLHDRVLSESASGPGGANRLSGRPISAECPSSRGRHLPPAQS